MSVAIIVTRNISAQMSGFRFFTSMIITQTPVMIAARLSKV